MPFERLIVPLFSVALAASSLPAAADTRSYTADYTATFLGIPVARATFTSTIARDGGLEMRGSLQSAGLARVFSRTSGNANLSAQLNGRGVEPRNFQVEFNSGGRPDGVAIRFQSGSAVAVNHRRPEPDRRSTYIPITSEHLRSVMDPLSATLVRASSAGEVCNRRLSVFDGWLRADIQLRPVSTGPLLLHEGEGAVCAGSFTPVAGFNADSRDMRHMRDSGDISITFAPLGDTELYAPVEASIGTRVGTVRISAGPLRIN